MLAYVVALGIAAIIPLVTGGSYYRLLMTPWRWGGLLLGGFAIQIFLEFADIPVDRWHTVGYGLLTASYVLILGFCVGNALIKGMTVVLIGVACNALVIVVNQGMPVDIPPDWEAETWIEPTIKHHVQDDDDRLMFLADIIVLRSPFDIVISFGDLILAVGLADMSYHASRRPDRKAKRRERTTPSGTDMEVAIDVVILDGLNGMYSQPRRRGLSTSRGTD
ncbi:MAG: DUF5317 family protein [Actinomycetota bacterium]|nr:DUF5317 family protein [Actinomycetota bacterium]